MLPFSVPVDLAGTAIAILGFLGLVLGALWAIRASRTRDDSARWRYRDRE